MSIETLTAGLWDCPDAAEYHRDTTCISHGMLECFRRSVAEYHGRYVTGTIPHPEPSAAMKLGALLHTLVLEPERFVDRYAIAPKCDRRFKDGKERWQEFLDSANGREVIDAGTFDAAMATKDAVQDNRVARNLLDGDGPCEQSLRWQDPDTQLWCKCRCDKLTDDLIINLKTAADPTPVAFSNAVARFGYHRGAEWYMRGTWHATGREREHVWIVVGTTPPHDVIVYRASSRMIAQARGENDWTLKQLHKRIHGNEWPSHYPGVWELELPRWAMNLEETW